MRVLVVDDMKVNQVVLVNALAKLGIHEVDCVDNAAEALFLYLDENHDYDYMLLDIVMPGLSGEDLLGAVETLIQRGRIEPRNRIVVVTAMSSMDKLQELTEFECVHAVLRKPVSSKQLRTVLSLRTA